MPTTRRSTTRRPTAAAPAAVDGAGRRHDGVDTMARSVTLLLTQREDLVGVHPLADLVHDAVRWCA